MFLSNIDEYSYPSSCEFRCRYRVDENGFPTLFETGYKDTTWFHVRLVSLYIIFFHFILFRGCDIVWNYVKIFINK